MNHLLDRAQIVLCRFDAFALVLLAVIIVVATLYIDAWRLRRLVRKITELRRERDAARVALAVSTKELSAASQECVELKAALSLSEKLVDEQAEKLASYGRRTRGKAAK